MKERHCCNCTGRERSVLIMFTCETCLGTFKRWSEYTRHLAAHEPELRSLCEHCAFTCNRKDSLKRHVERYHPFNDKILMSQLQETADVTVAANKTTGVSSIKPMEVDESTDFDLKLQLPNNFIYAGSTQSGKTTLLMKTLEHANKIYNPAPSKVLFLYGCWQDIYNKLRDSLKSQGIKIEFKQEGIITKDDLEAMADPNGGQTMIVIDDNSITASENKDVVDAFTKARHNNCSIVLLMHFNFASQNFAKIRANSGYYFLLKSCENSQQVALLGIKMGLKSALVRAYEQEAKKPYGYVLLDRRPASSSQIYSCGLQIFDADGKSKYFSTENENLSNWMKFIRPATSIDHLNLVAVQRDGKIFFDVTRPIKPNEEFRVWYDASYAIKMNKARLLSEDKFRTLIWHCFECDQIFENSDALCRHIDETHPLNDNIKNDPTYRSRKTVKKVMVIPKKVKIPSSKLRPLVLKIENKYWKPKRKLSVERQKNYCRLCHQYFVSGRFDLHILAHEVHGSADKMCQFCDRRYFVKTQLINYMLLKHDKVTRYPCPICSVGFVSNEMLNIHRFSHVDAYEILFTDLLTLRCPNMTCRKMTKSAKALVNHVTSVHALPANFGINQSPNVYNCKDCPKTFIRRDRFEAHLKSHTAEKEKQFECKECCKTFSSKSGLGVHAKTHKSEGYFTCVVCNKNFNSMKVYQKHSNEHRSKDGKYPCTICEIPPVFNNFQQLKQHYRYAHLEKKYKCEKCPAEFPRSDKLRLHLLRHSDFKAHLCALCGRTFKRRDKLVEHSKHKHDAKLNEVVGEQQTFTCQICQKIFCRQEKFREHAQVAHADVAISDYPQTLVSSDSDYPQTAISDFPQTLIREKREKKCRGRSLDEYIYKCHLCKIGFKRRGMLVNHMIKLHPEFDTNEIPELQVPLLRSVSTYVCLYCPKQYKSEGKRQAHVSAMHPGHRLPVSARIAPDHQAEHVTHHQITHDPFLCQHCPKQYATRQQLILHMKRDHSITVERIDNAPSTSRVVVIDDVDPPWNMYPTISNQSHTETHLTSGTQEDIVSQAFETAVNSLDSETGKRTTNANVSVSDSISVSELLNLSYPFAPGF